MVKTNKSFSKRLRLTKNGKVLGRKPGQDHFNAKRSRKKQLDQKRAQEFNIRKKSLNRFLPNN